MKTFKKGGSFLMVLSLLLCMFLAACGQKSESSSLPINSASGASQESSTPVESEAEENWPLTPDTVVEFKDTGLKTVMAWVLSKDYDNPDVEITAGEMASIRYISIQSDKVLIDRLVRLRYERANFDLARRAHAHKYKGIDDIKRAELYFLLVTHSFNSLKKNYRKGVATSDFRDSMRYHLPRVHERLQGVRVKNMDGLDIIRRVKNNPRAFLYMDPPYRHELRNGIDCYTAEMPHNIQLEMLELIRDAKCGIMLAGYRSRDGNDLYDKMLLPYGWNHYLLCEIQKSCQTKAVKDIAEEFIWTNYQLPDHARYIINMDSANW